MRHVLGVAVLALAFGPVLAGGPGGCGKGCCGGCGGKGGGAASASVPAMPEVRDTFHALLADHAKIKRTVEDVEGGVLSVTTSEEPAVAEKIRLHVRQMKSRMEAGAGLRHWDPLFVAIFENHDKIAMTIEDVPGGVRVVETSKDPKVTALIRQHARRGVSEFVARGFDRAHEPTPMP
jgi:uncharacterized protein YdcH (DUF465 family)